MRAHSSKFFGLLSRLHSDNIFISSVNHEHCCRDFLNFLIFIMSFGHFSVFSHLMNATEEGGEKRIVESTMRPAGEERIPLWYRDLRGNLYYVPHTQIIVQLVFVNLQSELLRLELQSVSNHCPSSHFSPRFGRSLHGII